MCVNSLNAHSSLKRHMDGTSHTQRLVSNSLCLAYNYKHPHNCSLPDCEFVVSWKDADNGFVNFTLLAQVPPDSSVWAAVGFSDDAKMVRLFSSSAIVPPIHY